MTMRYTALFCVQGGFTPWMRLPQELADVLPVAARNSSKPLLLKLLWELQTALGSRVHRIPWLHELLVAQLQVCSQRLQGGFSVYD